DLNRDGRFREVVVVERDHVNVGETTGTPDQNCFCAPNDEQCLSLKGDPGCFRHHGVLHPRLHPWSERTHAAGMAVEKSLKTAYEFLKYSQSVFSKENEGVINGLPDLAAYS